MATARVRHEFRFGHRPQYAAFVISRSEKQTKRVGKNFWFLTFYRVATKTDRSAHHRSFFRHEFVLARKINNNGRVPPGKLSSGRLSISNERTTKSDPYDSRRCSSRGGEARLPAYSRKKLGGLMVFFSIFYRPCFSTRTAAAGFRHTVFKTYRVRWGRGRSRGTVPYWLAKFSTARARGRCQGRPRCVFFYVQSNRVGWESFLHVYCYTTWKPIVFTAHTQNPKVMM